MNEPRKPRRTDEPEEPKKPKKPEKEGIPYCEAPSAEAFFGQPESCFDLVNQYGTYEIQPTADTENVFPRIAQGLGRDDPHRVVTRDELEQAPDEESR